MRMHPVVIRVVVWQLAIACAAAALWSMGGFEAALAALSGGVVSALLSLQFAIRVFSRDGRVSPPQVVADFYRAEAFKLLIAATLFMLAARYFAHVFVPLLTAFMATLVVYWVALLWKLDE